MLNLFGNARGGSAGDLACSDFVAGGFEEAVDKDKPGKAAGEEEEKS